MDPQEDPEEDPEESLCSEIMSNGLNHAELWQFEGLGPSKIVLFRVYKPRAPRGLLGGLTFWPLNLLPTTYYLLLRVLLSPPRTTQTFLCIS